MILWYYTYVNFATNFHNKPISQQAKLFILPDIWFTYSIQYKRRGQLQNINKLTSSQYQTTRLHSNNKIHLKQEIVETLKEPQESDPNLSRNKETNTTETTSSICQITQLNDPGKQQLSSTPVKQMGQVRHLQNSQNNVSKENITLTVTTISLPI